MGNQLSRSVVNLLWSLARKCGLGPAVLAFYPKSMLVENGWFMSFRCGAPMDASGQPLPWLTYAFIDFVTPRLHKGLTLFEYGCGFSTVWYCSKVKTVTAVENNRVWAQRIEGMLPANGSVLYRQDLQAFAQAIHQVGKVDIIVVDGAARGECYKQASSFLTDRGVIIADNSDWADFKEVWPGLEAQGFKAIPFSGITPSHFVKSQTSILYRSNNCLDI